MKTSELTGASDRELLKLAAKAAGIALEGWAHESQACNLLHMIAGGKPWNPLTDDGDALRLAAKLGITVYIHAFSISASTLHHIGYLGGWVGRTFNDEADYRNAIVRAAAEIGRQVEAIPAAKGVEK